MANEFDDIFEGLGLEKSSRGRKKGDVDPHTVSQDAVVAKLAKSAKTVNKAKVFTLPAGSITTKDGNPAGYDSRRAYAKRFCAANAGWVVAPKTTDGTVILVKR